MGYGMYVDEGRFFIAATDVPKALAAIKRLRAPDRHGFAWVSADFATRATFNTLGAMLDEWGWTALFDETGNVTAISFDREKIGDEAILFGAIAPYVRAGSYLAMVGEDGAHWRWEFDGTALRERQGRVVYD